MKSLSENGPGSKDGKPKRPQQPEETLDFQAMTHHEVNVAALVLGKLLLVALEWWPFGCNNKKEELF